ncbi:MAG: ATP-binding protein, partial [Methanophagales archaeon]|nr:ATP-binding protein [Methanophagales archaeon]
EIEFEDVNAFCDEQIEENRRLEYKKAFSSKDEKKQIAKEISAFANTHGGIILVGVDEKDRKPKLPIDGIAYVKGLNEKVTSIALKNIYPPVFPETTVCRFGNNHEKAVVVIRVQESDETPHTVERTTGIYVRVDSQNEPQRARYEEIEWLINRREKAVENRERLLRRAEERFNNQPTRKNFKAFQCVSVIPVFPHAPLVALENLSDIADESKVSVHNCDFPLTSQYKTAHESIVYDSVYESFLNHTEINRFGLIFSKQSLWECDNEKKVNLFEAAYMVEGMLRFSLNFYEKVGYWGLISINLSLEGIRGGSLTNPSSIMWSEPLDSHLGSSDFDDFISLERKVKMYELSERFDEIVKDLFNEILWSFGVDKAYQRKELIDEI